MATIADRIEAQQQQLTVLKVQQLIADLAKATRARDWASVCKAATKIDELGAVHLSEDYVPSVDEDSK